MRAISRLILSVFHQHIHYGLVLDPNLGSWTFSLRFNTTEFVKMDVLRWG
jgi:hypothetical protein